MFSHCFISLLTKFGHIPISIPFFIKRELRNSYIILFALIVLIIAEYNSGLVCLVWIQRVQVVEAFVACYVPVVLSVADVVTVSHVFNCGLGKSLVKIGFKLDWALLVIGFSQLLSSD